ncbi:MAG: hypothetical protein ACR2FZ_04755 [Thermoleophilaceae bacterium]
MARAPGSRVSRAARGRIAVRRAWPVILMAWERWQALPEADKERYRRQAREYAQRGRTAVGQARPRGRRPPRRF